MNCKNSTTPRRTSWWRSMVPVGLVLALFGSFSAQNANATTCAGATVLTYQNYPAFSIACGAGNDINSGNATVCGSSNYVGGQEAVYRFTSLGTGAASFAYVGVTWTGIFLYNGCPTSGGTCIGNITSSTTSKTLNTTVAAGNTYYLVIDTWPTPNSPCPGTIAITLPVAATPCNVTPSPGLTTGPAGACTGAAFTVGLQNATTGTGVSYQWQRDNGFGMTNFGTNAATQSVTQSVATSYQCIVTCVGNGSTTSTAVAIPMNGFISCYCIPTTTNGCASGDHITNATFTAATNPLNFSSGTCISGGSYSNYFYVTPVPTVAQTNNVAISCTVNNGGPEYAGAWIDFDHSGVFDASEFIVLNGGLSLNGGVFAGSVTIPLTSLQGNTGLRFRSSYNAAIAANSSCANYSYGETEDYTINIGAPPSCFAPSVTVNNITTSSAAVSWNCPGCPGTFYVEYGAPGFTPGLGAVAGAGGTILAGSPFSGSGPVTISGLTGLTNYKVVVRQECSPGTFSVNSTPVNFSTPCASGSCNYIVRIGDIYGDGWDGSQWELRQNGSTVAVIGPQLPGGCGPVDIPVSICSGQTISLHWTVVGGFSTEKALQLFDPFGVVVYDYRGPATYTSCPGVNWTSANNTVPGVFPTQMFSGVSSCTPPACVQPTAVSTSNITGNSADVAWTCAGCAGPYIVEYGLTGFTPGTGGTAGVGGTILTGAPVASSPVTITGLNGSTGYTVHLRQQCSTSNYSNNSSTSFSTGIDCATASTIPCGTPTSYSIPAGNGQFQLGGAFCAPPGPGTSPFCTPGKEFIWKFVAPSAGTYILNVTATSSTTYADYFFKAAPGSCDQNGWTYINDVFSPEQANFTIPAPGTYYILSDLEGAVATSQTFTIVCPLPCATPQGVTATPVTSTQATINWTCVGCTGSFFNVEYGLAGFTPGTGTVVTSATSPRVITGLNPTTSYQAYVTQDCNNVGDGLSNASNVVNFTTLAPPPANDDCVNAIPVVCGQVYSGNNTAATGEGLPSQASGGEATVDNGVWYVYTPTVTGEQVTASLCAGTTFDTRIHIFQGSCATPVGVAGADDVCGVQSTVTFNALPGTTYYIIVEGYFTASGPFQLTMSCGPLCNPLVTNDLCVNAQLITMSPNCIPFGGNLSCATNSAGTNPVCTPGTFSVYNDAYYTFQATAPDAFVTLTNAGTAPLYFVIYNGNACNITAGNQVFCSTAITSGTPNLVTGFVTNNFYTVRVMQLATGAGSFTMCVQKLEISDDPCTAIPLVCGDLRFGRTVGRLNNIPAGACPYNGVASTGGVNYFSYTAPVDGDVRFTTCGQTNFDSRISVFDGACTSLSCNVMNDNSAGCPGGSSEAEVRAVQGQTYTVMVHGAGALEGTYQLSVTCPGSFCSPSEANDRCPNSVNVPVSVIGDGTLPSTQQQACSYADAPTACSGPDMVQGVWFNFATTSNTLYDVYIAANNTNALYTAQNMNMALYSGTCNVGGASGASGEVFCFSNCQGTLTLPTLTPNSTYRLLVYNTGNTAEGTFGLRISRPGYNDAGIAQVDAPIGVICDGVLFPQVWLKNYGEAPLTSTQIISRIDGSIVQTYTWTGSPLSRNDSILVVLPPINAPLDVHDYTAETASPNGAGDELASNNAKTTTYDATGQTIKVRVRADSNPGQISWTIFDAFSFPVAQSVPNQYTANQVGTTSVCLPTTFGNCFYFFLSDAGGDGLCCLHGNGDWELRDVLDRSVLRDNGEYTGRSPALSPATTGYTYHEFCLPLGPTAPLVSECGIYNNLLNNKVYCNTIAGVTNYQFEFSDPDKGFLRRIGLPRNYVKFSEMVSNPLTFGTTYFCRVRGDQGSAGYLDDFFGNGCEMALAPVQPICTELISTPGATFSCGATKRFGGSSKIWAQPVVGATQYRFNFSNVGEGYSRNVTVSSYVLLLSWVSQPLVNGSTYDVKVECLVSGVWSGFCGATCQLTINNTPAFNNTHSRASETLVDENSAVQMWPNPVGDGHVNLIVSDLNEEIEHVTIDVYDVFGKRVMSETPVVSGETFNYILNLDKSMAAGVYTVNITINDHTYAQRLSVQ